MKNEFDDLLSKIVHRIARTLEFISKDIKQSCEEIRFRCDMPVCLTVGGMVMFVCADSNISTILPKNPLIADKEDIKKTLSMLCNNSVYLHENEIRQGFVSVEGGYRVGVCGSFNVEGMLVSVNSINIRIARQIFDCATPLLTYAKGGLLIAGPPASGKTTILRDIIRQLSNGKDGKYLRICVIDSRSEISGGVGVLDLGVNTDVLYTLDKSSGVQIALRTMYPNIIAFDEIGSMEEFYSVCDCFNAGVGIITTAHCSNANDLMRRKITENIINSGAIAYVALLGKTPNIAPEIIEASRLKNKC